MPHIIYTYTAQALPKYLSSIFTKVEYIFGKAVKVKSGGFILFIKFCTGHKSPGSYTA